MSFNKMLGIVAVFMVIALGAQIHKPEHISRIESGEKTSFQSTGIGELYPKSETWSGNTKDLTVAMNFVGPKNVLAEKAPSVCKGVKKLGVMSAQRRCNIYLSAVNEWCRMHVSKGVASIYMDNDTKPQSVQRKIHAHGKDLYYDKDSDWKYYGYSELQDAEIIHPNGSPSVTGSLPIFTRIKETARVVGRNKGKKLLDQALAGEIEIYELGLWSAGTEECNEVFQIVFRNY